jgi:hypothetical protein
MEFELLTWCCDKYNNMLALLCYAQSIAWSCMIANLFVRNTFKLIYPCVKRCIILIRWSFAGAQFTLAWTLERGRGLWFSLCFMALIKEIRLCTISCAYCTWNNRRQVKTVVRLDQECNLRRRDFPKDPGYEDVKNVGWLITPNLLPVNVRVFKNCLDASLVPRLLINETLHSPAPSPMLINWSFGILGNTIAPVQNTDKFNIWYFDWIK